MKPWNEANLIWMIVVFTAAIVGFCAIVLSCDYLFMKGTAWLCIIPTLIGVGYGIYAFVKKYLPGKEN